MFFKVINFIQNDVIEFTADLVQILLQKLEINPHPQVVELVALRRGFDNPVVAVEFPAGARVAGQIMGRRDSGLNKYLIHKRENVTDFKDGEKKKAIRYQA